MSSWLYLRKFDFKTQVYHLLNSFGWFCKVSNVCQHKSSTWYMIKTSSFCICTSYALYILVVQSLNNGFSHHWLFSFLHTHFVGNNWNYNVCRILEALKAFLWSLFVFVIVFPVSLCPPSWSFIANVQRSPRWVRIATWIKGTVLRSGRGVREGRQIIEPEGITQVFLFVQPRICQIRRKEPAAESEVFSLAMKVAAAESAPSALKFLDPTFLMHHRSTLRCKLQNISYSSVLILEKTVELSKRFKLISAAQMIINDVEVRSTPLRCTNQRYPEYGEALELKIKGQLAESFFFNRTVFAV